MTRSASTLAAAILAACVVGVGALAQTPGAQTPRTQTPGDSTDRDQVIGIPAGDPEMARAYAQARGDLAGFLALAAKPRPGMHDFAVKVGFSDRGGGGKEFFWIGPFERLKDGFAGKLGNRPEYVRSLREGQTVRFAEGEIVDWMYFDADGHMHGNRTACVLLAREGRAELREFEARYGLDCARNGL